MTRGPSLQKYLRELRGDLTQAAAGAKAGFPNDPRVTWNKLENGKLGLGETNATRIAAGFGRPIEELEPYITVRGVAAETLATLERLEARVARLEALTEPRGGSTDPQVQEDVDG